MPVFAVVGHWKRDRLLALLKSEKKDGEEDDSQLKTADLTQLVRSLPGRFPQEILLLVGQADLFPSRVEFRRLETPVTRSESGLAIPYQLSAGPMVVLEFTDVVFDAPITAGQFDYIPGDADWTDQTASVLQRLREQRQAQVATRDNVVAPALPAR